MPSLRPFAVFALAAPLALAQNKIDFQRNIRPILSDNCFQCHGPDSKTRMAGLRLDQKDAVLEVRKRGAAIVPGKPAESLLVQRITETAPAKRMPPEYSHKSLTPQQIAMVKSWVEAGAPWKEHWAYSAPVKPALPAVKTSGWAKTPIDRFVLARLEKEGLSPAPTASKRTLIRRVALDLTGLPPTPAETEAYLNDASPAAYEQMVDRYLASPHYGEHRARFWLDAARYGDTHGIHIDNQRDIWPFRDWVIKTFNANMKYDQFSIEQLAGDLLPNPTLDQRIATGFIRCGTTTNEAGIIEDEYAEIYAKDRAETVGAVWLGMTVGCATCHDHKFDPITQKDFYGLGAFFRNTTQKVMDGNISDTPPVVMVPRDEDREAWDALSAKLQKVDAAMTATRETEAPAFESWLQVRKPEPAPHAFPAKEEWFTTDQPTAKFEKAGGIVVKGAPQLDADAPFTISVKFFFAKITGTAVIAAQQDSKDKNRGWVIDAANRIASLKLVGDNGRTIEVRASAGFLLNENAWNQLVFSYDGSRKASGMDVYVNGKLVQQLSKTLPPPDLTGPLKHAEPLTLGKNLTGGTIADFRILKRAVNENEARYLGDWPAMAGALRKETAALTAADRMALQTWYLDNESGAFRKLAAEQGELTASGKAIIRRGTVSLVMEERKDQKPFAYVLYRGAYDQRRDKVDATTPSVLPPMTSDLPRNRLGFAKWLFTADHPLTARVAVNRMWEEIFGTGLTKTAEDFGSQGEPPVNQELLDYLAVDFRESGWDMKRFYKQVLMSAAYQQSAATTPAKQEKDPENRLISRGPRFRLDGETLRDYALSASGLLAPQIGGAPVKPYQPDGVWEAVAMDSSNTKNYKRDSGDALYRRSIYTFWKRSAPPAAMEIFNAPTRENCVVRRERTNTPLQALVTMNDVQFVEAARVLAATAMQSVLTFDERLDYISSRLLARPLTVEERKIARRAFDGYQSYYDAHPTDATKLLNTGERKPDPALGAVPYAAFTMLTSELMNLDEVLNK